MSCRDEDLIQLGKKTNPSVSQRATLAKGAEQFKVDLENVRQAYRGGTGPRRTFSSRWLGQRPTYLRIQPQGTTPWARSSFPTVGETARIRSSSSTNGSSSGCPAGRSFTITKASPSARSSRTCCGPG